jgi:hypothetical protein
MNIVEHVSLLKVRTSSGYKPKSGIAGHLVVLCSIIRGTARLISRVVVKASNPDRNGRLFLCLHSCPSICCHFFFILAILTIVSWNLRVVLICISLIIKDVEDFFPVFLRQSVFLSWEFFV